MIVERPVAKKSLALTLVLAIGLTIPGSAWSQAVSARVNTGGAAGAQSAAAVTGAQAGVGVVPNLGIGSMGLSAAPALSAPAANAAAIAAPAVAAAPALAAAASPSAARIVPVAAQAVYGQSARGAAANAATIAGGEAAANAPAMARASLDSLSREAGKAAGAEGVEVHALGRAFDGSKAYSTLDLRSAPAVDGKDGRSSRPSRLRPALAPAPAEASPTQRRMVQTLYQVASIFAEQYAPLDMKKDRFSLDLKREYDKAKAAVLGNPNITTRQFQDLLATLVASMRDYHVSISFHSTESSKLPFLVMGAEGRYFLSNIDREKLPAEIFPFKMGDEVVAIDGVPTAEAVKAIAARMTTNTPETDLRMAELFLTNRRRARGDNDIPQGKAEIVIRSKGQFYKVVMPWDYTPELLAQDVPLRNADLLEPEGGLGAAPAAPTGGFMSSVKDMFAAAVHPLVSLFSDMRAEAAPNPFMIGARQSFVPRLGKVLWRSDEDSHFDAYIFETKDGKKKGYVRIAAYDGDYAEVREFAKIIEKFEKETDALVIDQVNNPGGSVFYLYALASHLTTLPLVAPRHRLIIGEADAHQSAELLIKLMRDSKNPPKAEKKKKLKAGEEEEPPNAGGYPITGKFMALMVRSAQFILKSFNAGQRFTDLIHISGVADIDPAPKAEERYTKPILLLTNALDFSGGDFFPAIMQDNQRATIMGVRTAGAGGVVKSFSVNSFGIDHLSATGSLAQRPSGNPIENFGVTPDIPYEITAKDLRTGFAEYRYRILKALDGLSKIVTAPAPVPAPEGPKDGGEGGAK